MVNPRSKPPAPLKAKPPSYSIFLQSHQFFPQEPRKFYRHGVSDLAIARTHRPQEAKISPGRSARWHFSPDAQPPFAVIVRDGTNAAFSVSARQDRRGRLIGIRLAMPRKIPILNLVSRINMVYDRVFCIRIRKMIDGFLDRDPLRQHFSILGMGRLREMKQHFLPDIRSLPDDQNTLTGLRHTVTAILTR